MSSNEDGDGPELTTTRAFVSRFLEEHELRETLEVPLLELVSRSQLVSVGVPMATSVTAAVGSAESRANAPDTPASAHVRLTRTGLMAVGGMGEIHRAEDHALSRVLVMKVLHERFMDNPSMRLQFMDEAQVTAQLMHPGIPPVHEIGYLPDGRPFFTMKRVLGRTLGDIIKSFRNSSSKTSASNSDNGPAPVSQPPSPAPELPEVQSEDAGLGAESTAAQRELPAPSDLSPEPIDAQQWSRHRLMEAFQKVCEAVAYAHSRGVIHRDLKPANIMVGAFGEVLVMDWGLATVTGTPVGSAGEAPVQTARGRLTTDELVGGTPGYMPPEQALDPASVGPPVDVFALGVILHEIAVGSRPYRGKPGQIIRAALRQDLQKPEPLPDGVDDALWDIIVTALAPHPADRFADAGEMTDAVTRWREGALRRERALEFVSRAQEMLPQAEPRREQAASLRARARHILASLGPEAAATDKAAAWAMEDEAAALERDAQLLTVEAVQVLQGALVHAPGLKEARTMLARIYQQRHADAVANRDYNAAAQHEIRLKAHDIGEFAAYLDDCAPLELQTSIPCRAMLGRFSAKDRRLQDQTIKSLGTTPLHDQLLKVGSYVITLEAPGGAIRYPVDVRRSVGWSNRRPDGAPLMLRVPEAGELSDGEIFVGAGWFSSGGDPRAHDPEPARREWVDDFVIREFPVTMAELAEFLDSEAGRPWRAAVARDGLEIWSPRWPAVGLSLPAARAYAAWVAQSTGMPWRLPTVREWEKAARGVDGRLLPWGDFADPTFCRAREGDLAPTTPADVDDYPFDVSPYGVRGCGGNAREWCEATSEHGDRARVCGGSWRQALDAARCAARVWIGAERGYPDVAFRLVRTPETTSAALVDHLDDQDVLQFLLEADRPH